MQLQVLLASSICAILIKHTDTWTHAHTQDSQFVEHVTSKDNTF